MSRRRDVSSDWRPGQMVKAAGQGNPPPGFFKGTRTAALVIVDRVGHLLMTFERYYDEDDRWAILDRRKEQHPNVLYETDDNDEPRTVYLTCFSCVAAEIAPKMGWSITIARLADEFEALVAECRADNSPKSRRFALPDDL